MQATRGSIQFLGRLSGAGTLTCDGEAMGRATFEIDGFRTRTGEIVGSGEVRVQLPRSSTAPSVTSTSPSPPTTAACSPCASPASATTPRTARHTPTSPATCRPRSTGGASCPPLRVDAAADFAASGQVEEARQAADHSSARISPITPWSVATLREVKGTTAIDGAARRTKLSAPTIGCGPGGPTVGADRLGDAAHVAVAEVLDVSVEVGGEAVAHMLGDDDPAGPAKLIKRAARLTPRPRRRCADDDVAHLHAGAQHDLAVGRTGRVGAAGRSCWMASAARQGRAHIGEVEQHAVAQALDEASVVTAAGCCASRARRNPSQWVMMPTSS